MGLAGTHEVVVEEKSFSIGAVALTDLTLTVDGACSIMLLLAELFVAA